MDIECDFETQEVLVLLLHQEVVEGVEGEEVLLVGVVVEGEEDGGLVVTLHREDFEEVLDGEAVHTELVEALGSLLVVSRNLQDLDG